MEEIEFNTGVVVEIAPGRAHARAPHKRARLQLRCARAKSADRALDLALDGEGEFAPRGSQALKWAALGALWGGLAGTGFAVLLVPAYLFGVDFIILASPTIALAGLAAAAALAFAAAAFQVVWSIIAKGRRGLT